MIGIKINTKAIETDTRRDTMTSGNPMKNRLTRERLIQLKRLRYKED